MKVRIDEIIVGERRREDMGNIQELAESIGKYGLLHPIVIDDQNRLVAGGRRLEAAKLLGWQEIEARSLGELSERELRVIELEENLRRKDLTELEKSKNMVELAEIKAEELKSKDDFMAKSAKKSFGRPKLPDSKERVAFEIGVPRRTLIDAYQHVESIEKYPELEPLPKTQAIKTAKTLDSLPPEERPKVLEMIKKPETQQPEQKAPEEEERDKVLRRAQNFKKNMDRLIERLYALTKHKPEDYFNGLDDIEWAFNSISVFAENSLSMIDQSIEWLKGFREEYKKRIVNKPREIRRIK